MIILFFNVHNQLDMFFFPGEEFQYIDPADEEMDNGFVFSPVSVTGHVSSGISFLKQKIILTLNRVFDKKRHLTAQLRSFECSHALGSPTFPLTFTCIWHKTDSEPNNQWHVSPS